MLYTILISSDPDADAMENTLDSGQKPPAGSDSSTIRCRNWPGSPEPRARPVFPACLHVAKREGHQGSLALRASLRSVTRNAQTFNFHPYLVHIFDFILYILTIFLGLNKAQSSESGTWYTGIVIQLPDQILQEAQKSLMMYFEIRG
jgi:hypothetical protein